MRSRTLASIMAHEANSFGDIRLFAALAVVVSHSYGMVTGDLNTAPLYQSTGFTIGQHAVHVFFILSGTLVTASLMRSKTLVRYALSRCLRIFPGFAGCVLFTAFVLGPLVSTLPATSYFASLTPISYCFKTLTLITGSAGLAGVFTDLPIPRIANLSVWTLKYEVACYAIFAGLALLGLFRTGRRATLGLAVFLVICSASYAFSDMLDPHGAVSTFRRFAMCFSFGALAFVLRDHLRLNLGWLAALLLTMLAARGSAIEVPALLLATAYATLCLASVRCPGLSKFTGTYDLSFGLYLYSWPIGQTILLVAPETGIWSLITATLALTLPVALASWVCIESPALRLRDNKKQSPHNSVKNKVIIGTC